MVPSFYYFQWFVKSYFKQIYLDAKNIWDLEGWCSLFNDRINQYLWMNTGSVGFFIHFTLRNNYMPQSEDASNLDIKEEQGIWLWNPVCMCVGAATDRQFLVRIVYEAHGKIAFFFPLDCEAGGVFWPPSMSRGPVWSICFSWTPFLLFFCRDDHCHKTEACCDAELTCGGQVASDRGDCGGLAWTIL